MSQQPKPELLRLFDLYGANLLNGANAQAACTRDAFRAQVERLQAAQGQAATDDQLCELTAHLERLRGLKIVEDVEKIAARSDPDAMIPQWSGWSSACEEICHRLKTEAWGLQVGGGFGPTGAANDDDRPSPEFATQLRKVLATPQPEPAHVAAVTAMVPLTDEQIIGIWSANSAANDYPGGYSLKEHVLRSGRDIAEFCRINGLTVGITPGDGGAK